MTPLREAASWLAEEADRQAERLARELPALGVIKDHWIERARSTARRLDTRTPPTRTLQEATHA